MHVLLGSPSGKTEGCRGGAEGAGGVLPATFMLIDRNRVDACELTELTRSDSCMMRPAEAYRLRRARLLKIDVDGGLRRLVHRGRIRAHRLRRARLRRTRLLKVDVDGGLRRLVHPGRVQTLHER